MGDDFPGGMYGAALALSCLVIGAIAEGVCISGNEGGKWVLTENKEEQIKRMKILAQFAGSGSANTDEIKGCLFQELGPISAASALGLALILELELEKSGERRGSFGASWGGSLSIRPSNIGDLALNLLASNSILKNCLTIRSERENWSRFGMGNGGWGNIWGKVGACLGRWHGARDGYVGILTVSLRLGGGLAVERAVEEGIPESMVGLLGGGIGPEGGEGKVSGKGPGGVLGVGGGVLVGGESEGDVIGLSPTGVQWLLAGIFMCLASGAYRSVLFGQDTLKILVELLHKKHTTHLAAWEVGPGRNASRGEKGTTETGNQNESYSDGGPGFGSSELAWELVCGVMDILTFPIMQATGSIGSPTPSSVSVVSLAPATRIGGVGEGEELLGRELAVVQKQYLQLLQDIQAMGPLIGSIQFLSGEALIPAVKLLTKFIHMFPSSAQTFVALGGLDKEMMAQLLSPESPSEVVSEILVALSNLCRLSKDFYEPLAKADIYEALGRYLGHSEAGIRAKTCNVVGNMCRHSPAFYSALLEHGLLGPLIERCADMDRTTRKIACFAVGNAAFHNADLYERLRGAVPYLTGLLSGDAAEDKIKGNAAGALGNLVRNSPLLCESFIEIGTLEVLLELVASASGQRREAESVKVALFTLGTACVHVAIREHLKSLNVFKVLAKLKGGRDPAVVKYIQRIEGKFGRQ